ETRPATRRWPVVAARPWRSGSVVQDQVGDHAGGDRHQEHVAAVVAHPVVAVRRVAQVVARVVVHHVDRAMVVVMEALATRPDMARRRGRRRTVVDHDRAGMVAGIAVALPVAGIVVGAFLAAVVAVMGRATVMATAQAMAVVVAVTGGFGLGNRGAKPQ